MRAATPPWRYRNSLNAIAIAVLAGTGLLYLFGLGHKDDTSPRACYLDPITRSGQWIFGAWYAPPADQPNVESMRDCRYSVRPSIDGGSVAQLDPRGCYGLDEGLGSIVLRRDFCP